VPAAPSRRGTAAAQRSASRARPPGTPCRPWFLREFDDNRRISVTEDTLHCEEPEEAGSRRRDARSPASARGARRAHERRRCLVQLPYLDRHRSSPLKRNTIALSQMINRKVLEPSNNLTMEPESRPSIYTGFRTPPIMRRRRPRHRRGVRASCRRHPRPASPTALR
jgi:hypothetical protein